MGFPDRIERTMELAHPPAKVWTALTTAEGLGSWFGDSATVDLRPGGPVRLTFSDGNVVELRVERVDEPAVFAFTWQTYGEDEAGRTHVEFTLEPTAAGTRLTMVETGFDRLPDDDGQKAYDSHTEGWDHELGELVDHLDAA